MKKIIVSMIALSLSLLHGGTNASMAGGFLRYGLDARSESMARSVVADQNSAFNFYFNPASLNSVDKINVMMNYRKLSLDRSFAYLGASFPLVGHATIALGTLYTNTDEIEARYSDGEQFDTYSFNENMYHLSFALKPNKSLMVGLNLKLLYARFPDFAADKSTVSANSFMADLGAQLQLLKNDQIVIGAVVKDLGGKYSWNNRKIWSKSSDKIDEFPTIYDFGISFKDFLQHGLLVNSGVEVSSNKNYKVKNGLEFTHAIDKQAVSLRLGTAQATNDNKEFQNSLTLGIGYSFEINNYKATIDYAFVKEDITPENPHTISFKISL